MNNLVKCRLHGQLGEACGNEWDLVVQSVGEATRAIETIGHKLYQFLLDKSNENVRYRVIINGKDFVTDNEPTPDNLESIQNSELRMIKENLETIDIIPVLEGAGKLGNIFTAILGVILIVVGIILAPAGIGVALIAAGVGLLSAGVVGLLTKPPKFEDFREIEQGGKTSYLFSGPQNVVGEGGPVPLGYGRLLVGSQVISSAYVVRDFDTEDIDVYLRDEYGNLNFNPPFQQAKNCCFIFIQGEGELTQFARNYRDTYYGHDGFVANGYRWMAKWLVPLMKEYKLIQNFVKYSMTTPLSRFFEWHYKQNKYGFIFWPFKFWILIWRILGIINKDKI